MTRQEAAVIARAARAAKAPSLLDRFWSKVERRGPDECWPWKAAVRNTREGYGAFWLDGRHQPSNRLALILSGTPVPKGMQACHHCDNPRCCNPAHLFSGTHQANVDDKMAKLRHAHGETQAGAKLTAAAVAVIRSHVPPDGERVPSGTCKRLAEQFGTTPRYVSEVMRRGWGIPR